MKRLLILALLAVASVWADTVNITLSNVTLSGAPGQTLSFFGTLVNTSSNPLPQYLNSGQASFTNDTNTPPIGTDPNPFYTNAPFFLNQSGTTGDSTGVIGLFDVILPSTALIGTYSGSFLILGGTDGGDTTGQDQLGTAIFSVNVVPEPSTFLLIGLPLVALGVRRLRS